MNILKITNEKFEEIITDVQKELGIHKPDNGGFNDSVKKLIRPKEFIFNSYIIRDENGLEYRVNRTDGTFSYGTANTIYIKVKAVLGDTPDNVYSISELSGLLYDELMKKNITVQERANITEEAIYNTIIPVVCFEYRIMQLMESRNVTTVDLEEVQTVVKTNKPGNKPKKKGKKPRVTKEITLNFKDIERVVYSRPELPRTYTHHVESFDVAGHYRHYKSGKVVFVKGYTKGNKDAKISDKTYKINL